MNGGAQATAGAYRIGSADMLDITVFKVPELSKTVQVSETGTINLPLVGEVQAAGKTTQELERVLTAQARRHLPAKPASLGVGQRE